MNMNPRYVAVMNDLTRRNRSLEDVNAELYSLADDHTIEPIDDPLTACDFWDWADVVGVVDEYCPSTPHWATYN